MTEEIDHRYVLSASATFTWKAFAEEDHRANCAYYASTPHQCATLIATAAQTIANHRGTTPPDVYWVTHEDDNYKPTNEITFRVYGAPTAWTLLLPAPYTDEMGALYAAWEDKHYPEGEETSAWPGTTPPEVTSPTKNPDTYAASVWPAAWNYSPLAVGIDPCTHGDDRAAVTPPSKNPGAYAAQLAQYQDLIDKERFTTIFASARQGGKTGMIEAWAQKMVYDAQLKKQNDTMRAAYRQALTTGTGASQGSGALRLDTPAGVASVWPDWAPASLGVDQGAPGGDHTAVAVRDQAIDQAIDQANPNAAMFQRDLPAIKPAPCLTAKPDRVLPHPLTVIAEIPKTGTSFGRWGAVED